MDIQNKQLQKQVNNIVLDFEDKIKKIMSIEYHYNLDNIFKNISNLPDEVRYDLYEMLINYYLENLSKLDHHVALDQIYKEEENSIKKLHDIQNIIDFFDYSTIHQSQDDYDLDEIEEEASVIAFDLVAKVLGKNGRNLNLPVKVQNIKDFCINNSIRECNMHQLFYLIILDLSVIYHYVSNKKGYQQ